MHGMDKCQTRLALMCLDIIISLENPVRAIDHVRWLEMVEVTQEEVLN